MPKKGNTRVVKQRGKAKIKEVEEFCENKNMCRDKKRKTQILVKIFRKFFQTFRILICVNWLRGYNEDNKEKQNELSFRKYYCKELLYTDRAE